MSGAPHNARPDEGQPPPLQHIRVEPIPGEAERRVIDDLRRQNGELIEENTGYIRRMDTMFERNAELEAELRELEAGLERTLGARIKTALGQLGYNNLSAEVEEAIVRALMARRGQPFALPMGERGPFLPFYPSYRYLEIHIMALENGVKGPCHGGPRRAATTGLWGASTQPVPRFRC